MVVGEEVEEVDPAVNGGPHHAVQLRPLEVGPHDLVQLTVAKHLRPNFSTYEIKRKYCLCLKEVQIESSLVDSLWYIQ